MSLNRLIDPATTAEREPSMNDELLTVRDAARFLNVSVSWVYEHTRDDSGERLPAVKLGKYVRFDRRDLQSYIDGKRASARIVTRRRR